MRIIDTRIETMQIELLEASKEIKRCTNCYNGHVLLDTLGGRFDTYTNPEDALADKAQMIRDIIDENNHECNGDICLCVNVVVDVYQRDKDESRFSVCDWDEVNDSITRQRTKKEEDELEEYGKFTLLDWMPLKADKVVYHNIRKEKPESDRTVIALTDNGLWFPARYNEDGLWEFSDGKLFDPELAAGDVVAWFDVPVLHKLH